MGVKFATTEDEVLGALLAQRAPGGRFVEVGLVRSDASGVRALKINVAQILPGHVRPANIYARDISLQAKRRPVWPSVVGDPSSGQPEEG